MLGANASSSSDARRILARNDNKKKKPQNFAQGAKLCATGTAKNWRDKPAPTKTSHPSRKARRMGHPKRQQQNEKSRCYFGVSSLGTSGSWEMTLPEGSRNWRTGEPSGLTLMTMRAWPSLSLRVREAESSGVRPR